MCLDGCRLGRLLGRLALPRTKSVTLLRSCVLLLLLRKGSSRRRNSVRRWKDDLPCSLSLLACRRVTPHWSLARLLHLRLHLL